MKYARRIPLEGPYRRPGIISRFFRFWSYFFGV